MSGPSDTSNSLNALYVNSNKRLKKNTEQLFRQTKINDYIGRPLHSNEEAIFNKLLLKMTISNGWSFHWTENEETVDFFRFLSPCIKLPDRKKLSNDILKNFSQDIQQAIEIAAKEDQQGVTISLDGWKNVTKQNILGFVLTRSDGQVLIWGAEDISCQRSNTETVVQKINEFIDAIRIKDIKINGLVTDSASAYNAAR
jgi:hypothetical protein